MEKEASSAGGDKDLWKSGRKGFTIKLTLLDSPKKVRE